jgi:ribosomal protein L16/L10AE
MAEPKAEKPDTRATWICLVGFMKGGKYPTKRVAVSIKASGPHTAAARAIEEARKKTLKKGERVDQVWVKVTRGSTYVEAPNDK